METRKEYLNRLEEIKTLSISQKLASAALQLEGRTENEAELLAQTLNGLKRIGLISNWAIDTRNDKVKVLVKQYKTSNYEKILEV